MRLRSMVTLASWLGSVLTLATACGGTSNASDAGAPDGATLPADGGSGVDHGQAPLPFKPGNIDLTGWDLTQIGDVDLAGTGCVLDSELADGQIPLLCDRDFTNKVAHKVVTLADQSKLSVFVMKSLRIEASTVLSIGRGHVPVVLVTTGVTEIFGAIDVDPGIAGGAVNGADGKTKGTGSGGGTAGDATGLAGGGGSFCGLGGKPGTNTAESGTAPPSPTPAYGTPELVPLVSGSAGGNGGGGNGVGSGGGALEIVADSFVLHAGGHVNVGGGGGVFGGQGVVGAGGGGSGGALLIEANTVTVDGMLAANGGGGGQGNGDNGENGHVDVVAQGGHKVSSSAGTAGPNGSFTTTTSGADGATSSDPFIGAGGGGGGAGRIRINSSTGQATISGQVSPAQGTPCFTQGKLGT